MREMCKLVHFMREQRLAAYLNSYRRWEPDFTLPIEHPLARLEPPEIDVRVVCVWNKDMTGNFFCLEITKKDVSLIVEEPDLEKCYSFHNHTRNGGILSRDFTQGYGPVVNNRKICLTY